MAKKNETRIYGNTRDFAGNLLKPGDIIAYGQAFGRCAGLNIGVVIEAYQIEDGVDYHTKEPKFQARVSLYANQDTWKPFHKREVISRGRYSSFQGEPENLNKRTTLQFSDRCTTIAPDVLPDTPLGLHFKEISALLVAGDKEKLKQYHILC